MIDGFFQGWVERVKRVLVDSKMIPSPFEVKHVRKALDIQNTDRSKTIFIARVLDFLVQSAYLKEFGNHVPKKYEKIKK